MKVNQNFKHINKIHNIFLACIFHNMEFAYGNCSLETMIENITSDIRYIYKYYLPNETTNEICSLYKKCLNMISNNDLNHITKTKFLNAFCFLFLCFMEAYKIKVNDGVAFQKNILETARNFFNSKESSEEETLEESHDGWTKFCNEFKNIDSFGKVVVEQTNPKYKSEIQQPKPKAVMLLEQLFFDVCKLYASIKKINKYSDIKIVLGPLKSEYIYINPNLFKVWNCYCAYEKTIKQIQKNTEKTVNLGKNKNEKQLNKTYLNTKYSNYKKDVRFVCITYLVLNWLDDDKYKSLKPFENMTSMIDLQELWFQLSDTNYSADKGEKYSNKNDASSKWFESIIDYPKIYDNMLNAYFAGDDGEALINYMKKLEFKYSWSREHIFECLKEVIDDAEEIITNSEI